VMVHEGCVLTATCVSKPFITESIIVEAKTTLFVVVLCCDLEMQNVIFDGDGLELSSAST